MECQHSACPTISFHNPQFAECACWSESTTACLLATAWATSTIASLFSSLPGSGLACSTAPTSTLSMSGPVRSYHFVNILLTCSSQSSRMCPCPPCSSLSSPFSSSCLEWTCPGLRWWKVSSCYVFQLKQPGGYILLVRARCSAPLDDSPPRLPREAHPDRRHHLRGQPQDQLLQLGLAAELEGGARGALVPRAYQPLRQVEAAPQWGDLGHPEHLEVRGAQEQMRLRRPWPSGSRVQQ